MANTADLERDTDGSLVESWPVASGDDTVERLLSEVFTRHWAAIVAGPVIEGAAYEIRFAAAPALSMLDGYMTVDTGLWHFHLCVGAHGGAPDAERARVRRVARAAFFRSEGGSCVPGSWGLRLWNGRQEQMITIFFPNPWLADDGQPLQAPQWERTALWEDLRGRYSRSGIGS